MGWSFPSSTLCMVGFVARYWLNLVLSWNILFCPSMVIESFTGYSSLGWHMWSLHVCITLDHDLLAFIVSNEKSVVILIGLPLYVTWPLSLQLLIFFLSSVCLVLWLLCGKGTFLFQSIWCSVSFLSSCAYLFLGWEIFLLRFCWIYFLCF